MRLLRAICERRAARRVTAEFWRRVSIRNAWREPPTPPQSPGGRVVLAVLTVTVVVGALVLSWHAWRAVFGLALLAVPFAGLVVRPDIRRHRARRTGRDGTVRP